MTRTKEEELKLALDDLIVEYCMERTSFSRRVDEIFEHALAAQQAQAQEPVSGAQRQWVGLTDDEISAVDWGHNETLHDFARAIEVKLRSKNG